MKLDAIVIVAIAVTTASCSFRGSLPGRPSQGSEVARPEMVMEFSSLYRSNCAGCHGSEGSGGAAVSLADPIYLAIADNDVIRKAASNGVPGTAMPAFARQSGGMLTNEQIEALVVGIRSRWAKPDILRGTRPPPYSDPEPGDPQRGAEVYGVYCDSCHGAEGRGGDQAGSIVDDSYLALVSDQGLRTTVIVGRPELGAPDWRHNAPGKVMTDEDITDVVSWLVSQRKQVPGQPYPTPPITMGAAP